MSWKNILWFVLGTIAVMGVTVALLWQFGTNTGKPIANIAGNKSHIKGNGSIEIVEFSDFECPACKEVQEPLNNLLTKYEGKITFIYRHFPLTNIHPYAMLAAQAAEAADQQGKFWEMHDILFARQNDWSKNDPHQLFLDYAKEIGIDQVKFALDMEAQGTKDKINVDVVDSTRYQLPGTPTFFVNGVKTDFENIETKIVELTK